jgi:hypothetical protein
MFVSYKEFKQALNTIEIDVDEATGRVVIWGGNVNPLDKDLRWRFSVASKLNGKLSLHTPSLRLELEDLK